MKIKKIYLENFRGFYGLVSIELENFTAFIGKNDQGKSSILEALDIFINEGKGAVKIEADDLNVRAKNEGIEEFRIGVVFTDFPEEVIDETNSTLRDEYLLNEDGYLEVWKTFKNGKLKSTTIKCYHPANDDFLKNLLRKKQTELKDFVEKKNIDCEDKRKSASLRKAIREYYRHNGGLEFDAIEIVVDEGDVKNIWRKLTEYLPIYALFHSDRTNRDLDSEIQDPLKITVEQIFKRDDIQKKLNEIAREIENVISNIANRTIEKFKEISQLESELKPDIPEVSNLKWKDVYKNIGFVTDEGIPMNKRGSGFRRLVLLSFFLAEAERQKDENNVHTIYAIEEPETSLHPDLQKILLESLKKLSDNGNYQIIITTHSPQFIRLLEISSIRYVEKSGDRTVVEQFNDENHNILIDKIIKNLGILPTVGKLIICVEGKTDEMFLLNVNQNIPELKEIIDLQSAIEAGIMAFNIMRGSNLKDYIDRYITKNTNAIEFHLYDRDGDSKYRKAIDEVNSRGDGSYGVITKKREIENYVHWELIENNEKFKGVKFDEEFKRDWDNRDIPNYLANKKGMKEEDVKGILCGKISKQITKEHLEQLNAWDEVKGWFEKIREMYAKINSP